MKRAAVIGLGDISGVHIAAISANPNITLAAVCDIDAAKKASAPKDVPFYTDYREMLERERPDVVHICLPHYLHVPVSRAAAEMGIHVFCEKPMALNSREAMQFVELEQNCPKVHMGICLQNRYNNSVVMLKELIDSGRYGKVTGTRGLVPWCRPREYYEKKPWRGRWETAGGGCMINQAVHTLDLLYFLGGPILSVKASVSQLLDYDIEVEDTVAARLDYAGGARGVFMATNANYKNESVQIRVQLEKAEFLIVDSALYQIEADGSRNMLVRDDGKEPEKEKKRPDAKFYYGPSHGKLIGNFYEALETGSSDYLHVKDALMSIQLIDAIQESGRTGRTVRVPSDLPA